MLGGGISEKPDVEQGSQPANRKEKTIELSKLSP